MTNDFSKVKKYLKFLFHITSIDNLPSIARSGLLSHNLAHKRHKPTDISLKEVQKRRSNKTDPIYCRPLHDYVPLFFRARNAMLFSCRDLQPRLAVLYVNSSVLLRPNIVFTDGNAAAIETRFFNRVDDLQCLDWRCLKAKYWTQFEDGKRKRGAEVLIPDKIASKFVSHVVVFSSDARIELNFQTPWKTIVREEYFF